MEKRKMDIGSSTDSPKAKQSKLDGYVGKNKSASKQDIDLEIMKFVAGLSQSFSIMEHEDFVRLKNTLQPGVKILPRKAVADRIGVMYRSMKARLQSILRDVSTICCTADC